MSKEKVTKEKKSSQSVSKNSQKKVSARAKKSDDKKKEEIVFAENEKYYYAIGRRKTATAQVRIYPDNKVGENNAIVNGKKMAEYFLRDDLQATFNEPLEEVGLQDKFKISVLVKGGGISGQVEASRLGIARALVKFDAELRPVLKAGGFLTRDARKVERKKPGLKKARRAPQWSKR